MPDGKPPPNLGPVTAEWTRDGGIVLVTRIEGHACILAHVNAEIVRACVEGHTYTLVSDREQR